MLCIFKNGLFFRVFSLSPKSTIQLLHSLYYSSSNPKSQFPKPTTTTSTSLITQSRNSINPSTVTSKICHLLSDNNTQITNLDIVLKDYVTELNSTLVLQVLMNYRQLGRVKTLDFFSWTGKQMGFRFDDSVVEYMVDFFGRRKLFDDMKCFLLTVYSVNGKVSSCAFSICIRFLGRSGRIGEALCLFREMESKFRCKPDNIVCNNMLYVLCKIGNSEELIDVALDIFRSVELPDMYTYSNVLVGLCKFGRLETALDVFGKMSKAGLVPTRSAVNVLIGEFCLRSSKDGGVEKVRLRNLRRPCTILVPNVGVSSGAIYPALEAFWAVYDMSFLPSVFVIKQLISELSRLGKFKEAVEVLKVAEEKKLTCVEEGYLVVVQSLCESRLVEEVSHLFQGMLDKGPKPGLAIYNSIICMLCKLGYLGDAERVFKIMNKNRCLPNSITYTALIHAYAEAKNWEAAYDLSMEMLGVNWTPHYNTYTLADKLLKENDQMDLSINLERKVETQILYRHCKEGRLDAAYEKLKSMVDKGFEPPVYVIDAFEQAFHKRGRLKAAQELLGIDSLESNGDTM